VGNAEFFVLRDLVSAGRGSTRDNKRRYGSAPVHDRLQEPVTGMKRAGKVAGIVYPEEISLERAGKIVFCEGGTRQEKRVNGTVGDDIVTGYCAGVIDASSFGKTHGIVRVDDGIAKGTIAEPDKTARHSSRIN